MNNYIANHHNRIAKMFLIAGIVAGVVLYFTERFQIMDLDKRFDQEEEGITADFKNGVIDQDEYKRQIKQLQGEYKEYEQEGLMQNKSSLILSFIFRKV